MLIVIVKDGKQKSEVGVIREIVEKGKNRGNKKTQLETMSVYPYLAFTFQLMLLYGLFHPLSCLLRDSWSSNSVISFSFLIDTFFFY